MFATSPHKFFENKFITSNEIIKPANEGANTLAASKKVLIILDFRMPGSVFNNLY
jgi:hypothetical protein